MSALVETGEVLSMLGEGLARARKRDRRTVISATVGLADLDPCAAIFAARLASDRWFCWEQPDRQFALATLGIVHQAVSRGPRRFADIAAECLSVSGATIALEPTGLPPGAGPVWTGGFAFDPHGGSASQWSSLPPASMVLPEISLCRRGDQCYLTVNALVLPEEPSEGLLDRVKARLQGLHRATLPLSDPHFANRPDDPQRETSG